MALLDSELIPDLFLPENINPSFIPSQFSDSINDFLSDLSQTPPKKKDIKFILTKEDRSCPPLWKRMEKNPEPCFF